jgi:hypothetical protein
MMHLGQARGTRWRGAAVAVMVLLAMAAAVAEWVMGGMKRRRRKCGVTRPIEWAWRLWWWL